MVAAFCRKEPDGVKMRDPELTHRLQCRIGQRQVAVFASHAAMNANHHSLAVDVAELQVDRFADPQAERVSGTAKGLHAQGLIRVDDLPDLRSGDDFEFNDQVQQVPANVLLVQMIGTFLSEVSQIADGPQVSVKGPFGHACQSQIINHFLNEVSIEVL